MADELLTKKRSEGTLHLAPGALARRLAGRLLQREGLLLRRPLPRQRRDRRGQAADPQVRREQQLRDLPLHQLAGQLVARREVPRVRGQARSAGRHRHRGRRPEQAGRTDPAQAERRHHAVVESGRQAARLHRLRRRRSATSSRSTGTARTSGGSPSDKYGDLHPVWSPDGKTIAFATDRGPGDRLQDARVRQFPDRALRPGDAARSRCSTTWTRART